MASYGRQAAETYVKECSDGVYNYLKKGLHSLAKRHLALSGAFSFIRLFLFQIIEKVGLRGYFNKVANKVIPLSS